eukprot:762781-Hanusia_phi.AAC.18
MEASVLSTSYHHSISGPGISTCFSERANPTRPAQAPKAFCCDGARAVPSHAHGHGYELPAPARSPLLRVLLLSCPLVSSSCPSVPAGRVGSRHDSDASLDVVSGGKSQSCARKDQHVQLQAQPSSSQSCCCEQVPTC